MTCARCRKESKTSIVSMFNVDEICLDCKDAETRDPRYEDARRKELEACQRGDFNFRGIGY